ncbi:MAG TPA: CGNR zinc finger domain-containing protein [Kribbella sp.]
MKGTRPITTNVQPDAQPGGRQPAPGDLALVQSFVNSRWNLDDRHREQLDSPPALARWLHTHGLLDATIELTGRDLTRAIDVREGIRALLFVNNGCTEDRDAIDRLNRATADAAVTIRLDPADPVLVPLHPGLDSALAVLAGIIARAQLAGRWTAFKACPGQHCGWAFYDHSRNQTGTWCSMAVCGSRAKAKEYRQRKRQDTSP